MRLLTVAAAVAVLSLSVACGDDDDTDTDTAAPDTNATSEATESTSENQVLTGVVGQNDSATIVLADSEGNEVTSLPAGTYTVEISDLSSFHNFHLTGPGGVDEVTSVPETADVTWEVTFEAGTYTYLCDPHPTTMRGEFEVT